MTKELEIIDLVVGEGKEAVKVHWLPRITLAGWKMEPSLIHRWIVVIILRRSSALVVWLKAGIKVSSAWKWGQT